MAMGNPTIPVPGMPTPIAFLRMLALKKTSIFCGRVPNISVAFAVASATQMGSVQPIAGTTQCRTSAVICWRSWELSICKGSEVKRFLFLVLQFVGKSITKSQHLHFFASFEIGVGLYRGFFERCDKRIGDCRTLTSIRFLRPKIQPRLRAFVRLRSFETS